MQRAQHNLQVDLEFYKARSAELAFSCQKQEKELKELRINKQQVESDNQKLKQRIRELHASFMMADLNLKTEIQKNAKLSLSLEVEKRNTDSAQGALGKAMKKIDQLMREVDDHPINIQVRQF